ncbi:hypothetical protein [Romboutsia sp.]|uniref:hypothetical protein n=1 Tax=Romboutsia sp. TaxID=1965302 RepID=UPI003F362ED3
MKITQSKNQVFVKGLNDVEASILATTKKALEKDPEVVESSVDYIVLEVLRKVKQEILDPSHEHIEYVKRDEVINIIKEYLGETNGK